MKAGLEKDKACLLVVVGALRDGRKELLACVPGHRESTPAATGGGVATQLPRDRRGGTAGPPSDLAYTVVAGMENGDLFTLDEGQVTPRQRGRADGRHATTFAEPACSNC